MLGPRQRRSVLFREFPRPGRLLGDPGHRAERHTHREPLGHEREQEDRRGVSEEGEEGSPGHDGQDEDQEALQRLPAEALLLAVPAAAHRDFEALVAPKLHGADDVLRKYDPTLIFNVNVRVRDFPVKGFTLDAGDSDPTVFLTYLIESLRSMKRAPESLTRAIGQSFAVLTPIRSVDRIQVGAGRPGPVTARLESAFRGIVTGDAEDRAAAARAIAGLTVGGAVSEDEIDTLAARYRYTRREVGQTVGLARAHAEAHRRLEVVHRVGPRAHAEEGEAGGEEAPAARVGEGQPADVGAVGILLRADVVVDELCDLAGVAAHRRAG